MPVLLRFKLCVIAVLIYPTLLDITISPTYTAAIGLVSDEKGLSLRFPRFLKKREDKSIEEASTSEFLAGLWRKQEAKTSSATKAIKDAAAEEEDDLYD